MTYLKIGIFRWRKLTILLLFLLKFWCIHQKRMQKIVQSFFTWFSRFFFVDFRVCVCAFWGIYCFADAQSNRRQFSEYDLFAVCFNSCRHKPLHHIRIITYGYLIIRSYIVNWILSQFSCSKHLNCVWNSSCTSWNAVPISFALPSSSPFFRPKFPKIHNSSTQ